MVHLRTGLYGPGRGVYLGEEYVGIGGAGVQMGEIEAVGQGKGLGIDTGASYNIYM